MRLFTINNEGKLIPFKEHTFKEENNEFDLENLLEKNPEYFFEDGEIMIIGRQVQTNLSSFIDLLGLDKNGNTIIIELKRDKTPRETLAQLLEYASFVENLDYELLNEIFQEYVGEEISLDNYHQEYFKITGDANVSFNKNTKLVIVAQDITNNIKQTSLYLRKKGVDIYCIEFKWFQNNALEKMITCDFIIGEETYIKGEVKSKTQLPKVNEITFLESVDENGKEFFKRIFKFAESNGLSCRWGSKGFSLNLPIESNFVGLCLGYPPGSVFKQSIYSVIEQIDKKVNDAETIIDYFKKGLIKTQIFEPAGSNYKWIIDKPVDNTTISMFLDILTEVISQIKQKGLK